MRVLPRRADHPGERREDVTKDRGQVGGLADGGRDAGDFAEPGQRPVEQRYQRDEGQQHCADVQRQAQAVAGTGRRGVDDVGGGLFHLHLHCAASEWLAGFRDEDLGDETLG